MTKKIYLETLKSVLGRSISHYCLSYWYFVQFNSLESDICFQYMCFLFTKNCSELRFSQNFYFQRLSKLRTPLSIISAATVHSMSNWNGFLLAATFVACSSTWSCFPVSGFSFIACLLLRNRSVSKNGLMLKKYFIMGYTTKCIAINICQRYLSLYAVYL